MEGNSKPMDAMEWLESVRGVTSETAARLGVKANGGNLGFPYQTRHGEVLGHKVRPAGDKKFWFQPKGAARDLFNVQALYNPELKNDRIYITEGEIDTLTLVDCGIERCVSMPDGWTEGLTDSDTPKLKPIFDNLDAFKDADVVIAGDCDKVGRSMGRAIFGALEETAKSIRVVEWPDGSKDANDCKMQHGQKSVVSSCERAKIMCPLGLTVTGLHDLPPMPDRVIYAPRDPAYDDILRLELGTINVITGVPNHGKSTAAVAMLHSMAVNNRVRVGAVMFETHPYQLRNQLHRLETGREFNIDDPKSITTAERASRYWQVVHPQEDDGVPFDMGWVKTMIRTLALYHDCKIIVIDPWNELEHDERAGETETQYIKKALAALRKWAKRYDVAVVIIAHPKKMEPGVRPGGYHISGSSTWYDKAYMGLTVWRERNPDTGQECTEITAWKVKDQEAYGIEKGTAQLEFNKDTGGYRLLTDANYDRMVAQ